VPVAASGRDALASAFATSPGMPLDDVANAHLYGASVFVAGTQSSVALDTESVSSPN